MLVGVLTALAVIALDQASKVLVYRWLNENDPVVIVTPFFNLVAAWNTGVSFSMFNNITAFTSSFHKSNAFAIDISTFVNTLSLNNLLKAISYVAYFSEYSCIKT